jgi:RNA polymerase sigma-70 factor (ECF subfamily)
MSPGASDAGLLDAHLAGDPDAFGELVRRHRDVLWAVALRTTGNPADAEDALQEAMVSALRAVERFERRSAVRTWLYRIVVNASLDRLRRNAARPTSPLDEHVDPASPGDESGRLAQRLDVLSALQTLSPGQRAAVVLVHMHGLTVAEAAQVLDVPEGTVKSRCSRARAQLARLLAPGGDGPHDGNPEGDPDVQLGTGPAGASGPHATGQAGETR